MYNRWVNQLLRLDSWVYSLKRGISGEEHGRKIILWGGAIIAAELILMAASFPLGFFLTKKAMKQQGANDDQLTAYSLRWKLTLGAVLSGVAFWILKAVIGSLLVGYLVPVIQIKATSSSWNFDNPTGFIYDSAVIQIVDGMAMVKGVTPSPSVAPAVEEPQLAPPIIQNEVIPEELVSPTAQPAAVEIPVVEPQASEELPAEVLPSDQPAPAETSEEQSWTQFLAPSVLAKDKECETTLRPTNSLVVSNLKQWTGFIETAEKNGGEIYYQLSDTDGSTWMYWNNNQWKAAQNNKHYNTASEINSNISQFSVVNKKILFQAFFVSDCTNPIKLLDISITHETTVQPSPTPTPIPTPITPTPSPSPTPVTPSISPSPTSLASPSLAPTPSPSSSPVNSPDPTPTPEPSPTVAPTPSPTPTSTPEPLVTQLTTSIWLVPSQVTAPVTLANESEVFDFSLTTPTTIQYQLQGINGDLTVVSELPDQGTQGQYLLTAVYTGTELQLYSNGTLIGRTVGSIRLIDEVAAIADAEHAAYAMTTSALDQTQITLQYLLNRNTPPVLVSTQTVEESDRLLISYTLRDKESDYSELDQAQFSWTGEFTGEEQSLALVTNDSRHQSLTSLSTSATGEGHTIVAELPVRPSPSEKILFIRLRARDSLNSGGALVSSVALKELTPDIEPEEEEEEEPIPATESAATASPTPTTATSTATVTPVPSPSATATPEEIPATVTSLLLEPAPATGGALNFVRDVNLARESALVPVPTVVSVGEVLGNQTLHFEGTGVPNSEIMLYIFSNQAVMHRTTVNTDGHWSYDHDQNLTALEPGLHSVYATTLLTDTEVKSTPSLAYSFELEKRWWVTALQLVDLPTTLLTVFMAGVGVLMLQSKHVRHSK